jgi:hypothetical protein
MVTLTAPRPSVKSPRVKKAPAKPQRFARLEVPIGPNGEAGVLHLHVAVAGTEYSIRPIPCDFGEAFELVKLEEDGETYHVLVDDAYTNAPSCDCKGCLQWSHCKHADAIKALREAGRI